MTRLWLELTTFRSSGEHSTFTLPVGTYTLHNNWVKTILDLNKLGNSLINTYYFNTQFLQRTVYTRTTIYGVYTELRILYGTTI